MTMLMQLMQTGGNPQQLIMNMLQQKMGNNPMAQNMYTMLQNNDTKGLEQMARNMCKANGITPEQAIDSAKQYFKM